MAVFLITARLILALLTVIAVLIVIPAIGLGIASCWQVIFLSLGYFCFFLGTVWQVVRYGQLASKKEDRQVQATSGRIVSVITIIGLLAVHWLTRYTFSLQTPVMNQTVDRVLSTSTIGLVGTAIVVSQIAIRTLGKFFDRLTIKSEHQLVTNGIYSLVRHPIYSSYILLFLAFCPMLQSLWGFSLLLAVCVIWFSNRIGIEEQMLEEQFGEEYQSYCQRTKRLFPYVY